MDRKLGEAGRGLELFDLAADPFERHDLLDAELTPEQSAAFVGLIDQLSELLGDPCANAGDFDTDCVADLMDNCTRVRNGPNEGVQQDQCDTDGDGYGNHCDGDFDGNGVVGTSDLGILRSAMGTVAGDAGFDPDLDLNCDGVIEAVDLELLAAGVGMPPGPSGVSPSGPW